jgi:hypothetical protein
MCCRIHSQWLCIVLKISPRALFRPCSFTFTSPFYTGLNHRSGPSRLDDRIRSRTTDPNPFCLLSRFPIVTVHVDPSRACQCPSRPIAVRLGKGPGDAALLFLLRSYLSRTRFCKKVTHVSEANPADGRTQVKASSDRRGRKAGAPRSKPVAASSHSTNEFDTPHVTIRSSWIGLAVNLRNLYQNVFQVARIGFRFFGAWLLLW